MVERLRMQAVEALQPVGGVLRVGEQRARFAKRVRVELNQSITQLDVCFRVAEFAVRRTAQLVNRPVLMKEPGDFVRMAGEVAGELGTNGEIDPFAVRFAEVNHPPCGDLCQQFVLGIPLERHRRAFSSVAAPAEVLDEASDVELRAAMHEGHLRRADDHRLDRHVACRKLMMSPSTTMYSLPSRRTSPWSRHTAIEPRL